MKLDEATVEIIKDSRGSETVLARVVSGDNWGEASVPSGRSRSSYEAYVLEPHIAQKRFLSEVKEKMLGRNFEHQDKFDNFLRRLDGTADKRRLGGNTTLALSLAFARTAARERGLELYEYINRIYRVGGQAIPLSLPRLIFNLINGGKHAMGTDLSFQEFQVIPQHESVREGVAAGRNLYKRLGEALRKQFGKDNVELGDEAGYAVKFGSNERALAALKEAVREDAFRKRVSFDLGIDAAANSFYDKDKGIYRVGREEMKAGELAKYYRHLAHKYGLMLIEDPFHEEAFADFAGLNKTTGFYVVADDLTATNLARTKIAVGNAAADAMIVKPNQAGTLTETVEAARYAHRSGWQLIVSHRSGETEDDFIADLAVGINAWGIKAGAPETAVRMAKYYRLEKIEKELEGK